MSTKVRNSLSTFLEQALILEENNLKTYSKINDAVNSNEESISLSITDPKTGEETNIQIPSFGYLKNSIKRLEENMKAISGITPGTNTRIRLSDGSYRKIIASKLPSEAPTITRVNNITNFNFKSNWFFEDMLNPMLYITWDFTNQIPSDTERVMIQRFILNCDTARKVSLFDKSLKGRNNIGYKELMYFIQKNKIRYTLDDDIKDLPPRDKRYSGIFSVLKVETDKDLKTSKNIKRYTLNTLSFTDNRAGFENTRVLTVGDKLELNTSNSTTSYKVVYVDNSTNKVSLQIETGFDSINIGKDVLKISSEQDTNVSAEIPVGYGERQVIFIKPIDADSNIPANKWSPGVAFFSNELTYVDSAGNVQTLQKFYQKNVVDFGQVLLSYFEDYYPTIREGIKPNAPSLSYMEGVGNFRIVQINNQLTENTDSGAFRKLVSDKNSVQAAIEANAKEIAKQKEALQTTNYATSNEKLKAQSALNTLISNQETLTTNYNSIVNTIKSKYTSGSTVTPKYRVRGFWDIPEEKISPATGIQKIIKFRIRYRYLSSSGTTNKEEEFEYTSGYTTVKGRFSNWIEEETKLRPRVKGTNGWEWADINTSDPEEININQLDIPIQKGEQVEIQIKSISEAGWPANPMESDWSSSIIVKYDDFPELDADDVTELIEQNKIDSAVANVTRSLSSINSHMNSSFYANEKYFAHSAETIASGFLTSEQTPITLFDKLHDLQTQIEQIVEQIATSEANLVVRLVDGGDNNKIYNLVEGDTTYINAGDYITETNKLDRTKRNGAIITKKFYLDISSENQSGLILLSKLSGNRMSMVPSTVSKKSSTDSKGEFNTQYNYYDLYDNVVTPSTTASNYYNTIGRYDLVPINLTSSDIIDFQMASPNMYQSAQCKGQFVYSRFRNIGDTYNLYANTQGEDCGIYSETASFLSSEVYIKGDTSRYSNTKYTVSKADKIYLYNTTTTEIEQTEFNLYKTISGSTNLSKSSLISTKKILDVYPILYRLPKTWKKPVTANKTLLANAKIQTRLFAINGSNLTVAEKSEKAFSSGLKMQTKLAERAAAMISSTGAMTTYSIEPKIQSAYGFSDMGKILKIDLDGNGDYDDGSYLTTHKIGFEDKDFYANGTDTCNSFLFLSPINHTSIQVDGDTSSSTAFVSGSDSIRVPIIYQYRMKDRRGYIFGQSGLKESDATVKNTKYANIIGLDIWTDTNSDAPLQYDIIVYSSYSSSAVTDENSNTTITSQSVNDLLKKFSTSQTVIQKPAIATTVVNKNTTTVAKNAESLLKLNPKVPTNISSILKR